MSVSSPEPLHKKHSLSPSHQSTRNAQKQRSRVDATWREANPFTASPTSRGINTRLSSHIREIWSELTCRFFGASRINTAASTPQSRITLPEKRFRAGRKESIARDTHKKTLRLLSTGVACSFFFTHRTMLQMYSLLETRMTKAIFSTFLRCEIQACYGRIDATHSVRCE